MSARPFDPSEAQAEAIAHEVAAFAAKQNPDAWGLWDGAAMCPACLPAALSDPENPPPSAVMVPLKGDTCESCGKVA